MSGRYADWQRRRKEVENLPLREQREALFETPPPSEDVAAADRAALAADEDVAAGELTSVTYRVDAGRPSNEPAALLTSGTA